MAGVVGAVEGEVPQRRELSLDAVQPGRIRGRVRELDVARRSPVADAAVAGGGQVRAEVVADDRDAGGGWVEGAQVAAELQEPGPGLARLEVPEQPVLAQLAVGEQVPYPGGVGVSGARPYFAGPRTSSSAPTCSAASAAVASSHSSRRRPPGAGRGRWVEPG